MITEKVIEYGVAAGENHFQLAQVVNDQRKDDWVPFESVFQYQYGDQLLLCQPMVKYEVKKRQRIK